MTTLLAIIKLTLDRSNISVVDFLNLHFKVVISITIVINSGAVKLIFNDNIEVRI